MKRIVVHIDSLALKGFRHEDRHAIAEGLQEELARLFAEPAAAAVNIGNNARLPVGKVPMEHGAKPQSVGAQTARGIAPNIKP